MLLYPAQRDCAPILPYRLAKLLWLHQPYPAPGTLDEHLPAQLPGPSEAPFLQRSPCGPSGRIGHTCLSPIVPCILFILGHRTT